MTKILAITPSFTAWRRAADTLLTLETAVALGKRSSAPGQVPPVSTEQIEKARLLANQLFEIAQAETSLVRGHVHGQVTGPMA
jgi:hypothetical protein